MMGKPRRLIYMIAIGLGVAGMLLSGLALSKHQGGTLSETASAVCSTEGGCDEILQGSRSEISIPAIFLGRDLVSTADPAPWTFSIALIGLWYFTAVTTWLLFVGRPSWSRRKWHLVPIAAIVIGCSFSIRCISLMAAMAQWCQLCLATHAVNFVWLVFVALAWPSKPLAVKSGMAGDAPAVPIPTPSGRLVVTTVALAVSLSVSLTQLSKTPGLWAKSPEKAEEGLELAKAEFPELETASLTWKIPLRRDDVVIRATESPSATLVVFTDLRCENCTEFDGYLTAQIVPVFKGHLDVVIKHFPLCTECNKLSRNIHPYACQSACVAEAARLQGGPDAFLNMMHLLRKRPQIAWTKAQVLSLARQLGLDGERLDEDRQQDEIRKRVSEDVIVGWSLNIQATPATFLDGQEVDRDHRQDHDYWVAAARKLTGESLDSVEPAGNVVADDAGHPPQDAFPADAPAAAAEVPPEQSPISLVPKSTETNGGSGFRISSVNVGEALTLAGPALDGSAFDLATHKGKVVVVSFSASWCGLCVDETAQLLYLNRRYGDEGLEIVTVSADVSKTDLEWFVQQNGVSWPQIYFDEQGKRGMYNPLKLQLDIRGLPCQYVVDREGNVSAVHVRGRALEMAVAEALGQQPSPEDDAMTQAAGIAAGLKRPENPASPPLPRLEPGIVPLIDGPTADGGKFDVKQWRGKVVLVAYWGSWCPFSRRELAPVLDAYNRYHADGFEVVGVSCEVSRDVLFDYTAEHRFNFPQLYFDEDGLRGAENPLFQRYGVKAVPTFVLLDREGRIVKETSRASDVEIGVAEMLGKVPSAAARKHSDSATTQHVSQAVVSDKPLDLTPVQDEPTEDGFPPQ